MMIGTFLSFLSALLIIIAWRASGWWSVAAAALALGLSLYAFFGHVDERDGNWPMFLCIIFVWLSIIVALFLKMYV
jgi:hypothetical protein